MPEKSSTSFSQLGFRKFFSTSMRTMSDALKKPEAGSQVGPAKPPPISGSVLGNNRMPGGPIGIPTALDKIFLVWSGQFKSRDEIPNKLEGDVIHRARSFARIRINVGFLFIAGLGGGLMVYLGKKAAARGENLERQNLEWHRKIKEDYEKEKSLGRTEK